MKNYREIKKFKEEAATLTENICNVSVNNIDAAFNIGYEQGYMDGKEAEQQEYATALHDIEDTYIRRQKAEYEGSYEDEDGKKYPFEDASIFDVAYLKGLQHGQELRIAEADCAYKKGLSAAWETAKKILLNESYGGYTYEEIKGIFGKARLDVIKEHSIQEVISKIEASKKQTQASYRELR